MSNFLAPATVTAALKKILEDGVARDANETQTTGGIPGPTPGVTTGPPNAVGNANDPAINIFLYQVIPNAQWRNHDLPTRNARGELARNPRAAIDLHYLITFFGAEGDLEPQRLMGSVVHQLNDEPVLTRPRIKEATDSLGFLEESDLANEIERVKFTPIAYSLEELSKLWSVFGDTPYRLSIAYSASVVFVEAGKPELTPLPVLEREVIVVPDPTAALSPTPDQIPGLALWLASDREVTFDVNGVSAWNDLSGNDNHAGQTDSTKRPALIPHGLGRRPVLRFDGINDLLELDLPLTPPLDGLTVALVARMAGNDCRLAVTFNGFAELLVSESGDPPLPTWQTTDTTSTSSLPLAAKDDLAVNDTNWHAIIGRYAAPELPNNQQLYIDGELAREALAHGNNKLGSANTTGLLTATGGGDPDGDVAELIIYNRALTEDEREQLERYFANRYG
jgi:hypothetical protein